MKRLPAAFLLFTLGACAGPEIHSDDPLADQLVFEGSQLYYGRVNSVKVSVRQDASPELSFHKLLVILFDDLNGDGRFQKPEERAYRAFEGQPTRKIDFPNIVSKEIIADPWFWAKVETNQGPVEVRWSINPVY